MCCLKYEQDAYEDAHMRLPEHGDIVSTPEGKGVVQTVDYLRETARIRLEREDAPDILTVPCSDLEVIVQKRAKKTVSGAGKGKKPGCPKTEKKPVQESAFTSGDPIEYDYEIVSGQDYTEI